MSTRDFGTLADGRQVHEVTLSNELLTARFLTLGARINGLTFDGIDGLTPALSLAEAEDALFCGSIIGPVMNRLSGARAPLDGAILQFEANEGPNLLHSGDAGFDRKVWDIAQATETEVTFTLDLPPDAFPGHRKVQVTYRLENADLILEITATTDAPTLMNMGFHPFWTLSRQGRDGHDLQVHSDLVLPADDANIPTGEIVEVAGTPLDYRVARPAEKGIDRCFVLGEKRGISPCVTLRSDALMLEILTDARAVHVFTGMDYGIAVEPEIHPDAPNNAGFPSIRLDPADVFRQTTVHRFSRR